MINTLAKVSNAFAYVEKSVADTAAGITAAANAAAASGRPVMDSYDQNGAVTGAQSDINAAFARYGATAPTDRAGLAAVANSIDTNTALGREQMAALQALTGAFDTVFAARQATSSQRSLQDSFRPIRRGGAGAVRYHGGFWKIWRDRADRPRWRWLQWPAASTPTPRPANSRWPSWRRCPVRPIPFSGVKSGLLVAADAVQPAADEQARIVQQAAEEQNAVCHAGA